MTDQLATQIDAWLQRCEDPARDPLQGMAEAGLLRLRDSYAAMAQVKAALVARTGLLGVGGIWSGPQLVNRFFIAPHATEEQRATWLGKLASVAISEPGVGAHPKHLRTYAEPDGDYYRIAGEKAWVSNAPWAEVIIVFAITSQDADGRKRYSAFLVPRDTPGLTLRDMTGFRALQPSRHAAVTLDGCRVPRGAMLGPPGVAYERMALPFRDTEDAVGGSGLVGAFQFLCDRFRSASPALSDEAALAVGGLIGLLAVLREASDAVVEALDTGRLATAMPQMIGLRVLAAEMLSRARSIRAQHLTGEDTVCETVLDDIEASLSVARGPRQARQARLATAPGGTDKRAYAQ